MINPTKIINKKLNLLNSEVDYDRTILKRKLLLLKIDLDSLELSYSIDDKTEAIIKVYKSIIDKTIKELMSTIKFEKVNEIKDVYSDIEKSILQFIEETKTLQLKEIILYAYKSNFFERFENTLYPSIKLGITDKHIIYLDTFLDKNIVTIRLLNKSTGYVEFTDTNLSQYEYSIFDLINNYNPIISKPTATYRLEINNKNYSWRLE